MYLLPGGIWETCFTFHCYRKGYSQFTDWICHWGVGEWQLRSFVKFKTLRFNEEVKQSEASNDPWVAFTVALEKSWVSEFKEWSWWDRRDTGLPFCLTSVLEPFEFKDEYLFEMMANGELFKETEIAAVADWRCHEFPIDVTMWTKLMYNTHIIIYIYIVSAKYSNPSRPHQK